jgi:hypothetical protein
MNLQPVENWQENRRCSLTPPAKPIDAASVAVVNLLPCDFEQHGRPLSDARVVFTVFLFPYLPAFF